MSKCREQLTSTNSDKGRGSSRLGPRTRLYVALAMSSLAMVACSSDDDDDDAGDGESSGGQTVVGDAPQGRFAVASNDGTALSTLSIFSPALDTVASTFTTTGNEGLAIGADGTLFQNSDVADGFGIRAINQVTGRANNSSFDASDRVIGAAAGKGLFLIDDFNLLASCDVTSAEADLQFFSSTAGAQATALGSVDLSAPCWDGAYSAVDDRIYLALTDGNLAIIDDVSALNLRSALASVDAVSRTITPVGEDGEQNSINLHGVGLEGDAVLLSDVGSAAVATDGALFVFTDDGDMDGDVAMTPIAGPATMLGNPVDLILQDGAAIVAEKSNNAVLVFESVATLSGDVAPDFVQAFTLPESIVSLGDGTEAAVTDASDISADDTVARLLVAQNPAPDLSDSAAAANAEVATVVVIEAPAQQGAVAADLDISLSNVTGTVGAESFTTLENVQIDASGNGYVSFDVIDGTGITDSGILVVSDIANRQVAALDLSNTDRAISGLATGLTNPKGVEIVASQGAVIIADVGAAADTVAPSLVVFSTSADGDAAPLFTVTNTGTAAIWDMDYDPVNDRLYAAGTAGDVLVYDGFFAAGASAAPTRTIRADAANAGTSRNMHGIAHDLATDTLIVTDVGDAASDADGILYTFPNASTADGVLAPRVTIRGGATVLGNPVDLAFDGTDVYIAEKLNDGQVLIYRDVLNLTGQLDLAADESVNVGITAPESVTLVLQ